MKNFIGILVITLFSNSFCFATKDSAKKEIDFKRHEFIFGVHNPFNSNNNANNYLYWQYDYYGYYPFYGGDYGINTNSPQFGLGYKYHLKKSSIRLLVNGNKKSDSGITEYDTGTVIQSGVDNNISAYSISSADVRLGYERNIGVKSFQFYFGVDGFYSISNYNYSNSYDYTYETNQWVNNVWTAESIKDSYENSYKTAYSAFGASPILGIKYYINDFLSISAETRIDVSFYNSNTVYTNSFDYGSYATSDTEIKSTTNNKGNDIGVYPFKLISINAHF